MDFFAFTDNDAGVPVCFICGEKFAKTKDKTKESYLERHFQNKHSAFSEKYPTEDEQKKAISEL